MAESNAFLSPPTMKAVRFGGNVLDALAKYSQGHTKAMNLLKRQLSDPDIKDAQILHWLYELRISVEYLTIEFKQLVRVVLDLPWLNRSKEVVEEYLSFLIQLVSTHTEYLKPSLYMIVSHFFPPRVIISDGDVQFSDSEEVDEDCIAKLNTCHRALQGIAQHVPSTPHCLMPILVEKFPSVKKSPSTLECYIHNLLRITVYFPKYSQKILELVTKKLVKIDMKASRQAIEDAEQNACIAASGNRGAEEDSFNAEEDRELEVRQEGSAVLSNTMAHPAAERLDVCLNILFKYIKEMCILNGENTKTKALYKDLLAVFDKFVLPTHASSHVPFTMFYICSFNLKLTEAFLEHLRKILQNPRNLEIIRQTAADYMGSFLSRAKYIPLLTVKAYLDMLVNWLHSYLDILDCGGWAFCDVEFHGPFYAACQAVFYIVIYRHKQLLDGDLQKGLAYLQALKLERIVMCQLNPLKMCLPTVVDYFATIAKNYQLVYCYTIIERNRQMIPTIRSSAPGCSFQTCVDPLDNPNPLDSANPLESRFPFDPCVLKRCKKMIDPLYQPWEESIVDELKIPNLVQMIKMISLKEKMPRDNSVEMTPGS